MESRTMIERARRLVEKFDRTHAATMQEGRERIQALRISDAVKRDMVAGFENGLRLMSADFAEQKRLEQQLLAEFEKIIELLSSGKWLVRNEQIFFASREELDKFRAVVATIASIAQQQEELEKNAQARADQKLEELRGRMPR